MKRGWLAVLYFVLVSPTAVLAQPMASVTTGPFVHNAPVLGIRAVIVLAVALVGLGVLSLRTRSAAAVTVFVLVAALTAYAGFGYAIGSVVVSGGACNAVTTQPYDIEGEDLVSLCANPIEVIAFSCSDFTANPFQGPTPPCAIDQILTYGQVCKLPGCIR